MILKANRYYNFYLIRITTNVISSFGLLKPIYSSISFISDSVIEEALHIAYIAVDEKGTVAAAVTSILEEAGMNGGPIVFDIDRPFIFLIRDIPTGTILFIGRVLNPNSANWDVSPDYETSGFSVYPHENEPQI